ncbi:MAG: hypothetical protein IKT87_06075 [Bacteroidaceae bacterium]|nr:hypothetical protein [Bacteroidaceae bacterium]MBR5576651.1 hypothetical protein [Bacteroidaceae bacterium]
MADIHIIDSIRLNHKGLCTLDEKHKWVKLHKQQGDLDGACAIYSLVMAMLCKGLLTDDETQVYNRPDRRTDKGKFLYQFFNERGMIRDGYSYVTLAKEINESSFGVKATRKNPRTNNGRVELISDYIYDNIPVIISVVFENETAHALLAVGIEVDSNEEITKIYCLDPGYPSPRYSSWNCFIDVSKETKSDYPFYCVCEDGYSKVSLDDMLIIDKE